MFFKDKWANQFAVEDTTYRSFHVDVNTTKQIPIMYRKDEYKYVEMPEYKVKCIELPYVVMLLPQILKFSKSQKVFTPLRFKKFWF